TRRLPRTHSGSLNWPTAALLEKSAPRLISPAMLDDRDYMRQPAYHEPRFSFTVALLVVNAAVFIVQLISTSTHFPNGQQIQDDYFALSLNGLEHYRIWQLLTFQFM